LTTTFAVDVQCFVQAFHTALNMDNVDTNWAGYRHVTDSGVVLEAFHNVYGRDPHAAEISRFIECFVSFLIEAHASSKDLFGQVPGAAAFLTNLHKHPQWRASIATGGW